MLHRRASMSVIFNFFCARVLYTCVLVMYDEGLKEVWNRCIKSDVVTYVKMQICDFNFTEIQISFFFFKCVSFEFQKY